MTNPFQKSSPGLIRAATQPAIAFSNQPYEEHAAPQSPLELHDESGIDYSNPQQPTLLEPQRQGVVQSLQDIPYPVQPNQPNRLLFRQESVQGSRVLQVDSLQRTPEPSRIPGRTTNPSAFARQAAHIEINVPEHPSTTQNEEIPGSTAELQENHENSLPLQDPQAESIKKAASLRLWTEFSFNAFMLISYVLGYLYIDEVVPANAVFGVSFGFLLVAMLGPLRRKGLYADFDRVDVLFSLAHLFCLGAFLVLACLKINGVQVPLTHVALGGLLILFCSCCKSSIDEPSPFKASLLLLKLFIWIQLIILSIRIDGLPLPWGTVFIPAYFTLVVLAFSSILVILGSLFAFFNVIRQEGMSAQLLLGSLWYIFNALYTGIWFAILNGVVTFLDDPNEKTYIHIALRVGIIHSGSLFLFTAFLWRTLLKFQEFEVHSEMLIPEESEVPDGYDYENQNQNTRIRFQVVKDNKTYLTMISSTFYSYVGKHLKNNNATNSNEIKSKIENAKMHKRAHGLALNVPHHTDIANNYQNQVSSPVKVKSRNLDFSDGDIKTSAVPSLMLKKGESMRSNAESCVVCFDNVPNGVFMDCGHGGVCYECALDSWKKSDNCVFCRQRISKVLKIVSCKPLNITKVVETTTKVVENV